MFSYLILKFVFVLPSEVIWYIKNLLYLIVIVLLYLGVSREDFALGLLEQFKSKLHNSLQSKQETKSEELEDEDDW